MRKLIVLVSLVLLLPVVTQAKSLEDLLVEKGVITKGEAQGASGTASKVYWNGGTRVDFDNGFTTKINTEVHALYTFTDVDEDDTGAKNSSSFTVPLARIIVWGTALNNEFEYKIQPDFVGTTSGGARSPDLRDAWIAWHGCDVVTLKMGQFKTGISRQFNTEDSKFQFYNRSLASDFFSRDRQNGLSGDWNFGDGAFAIKTAIFNGESDGESGRNRPGVDTRHTGIVNVRFNAMGKMDVAEEGDVNWTEDPALSIGAAYAYAAAKNDLTGSGLEDGDTQIINVDVNFKMTGWSLHGEYYHESFDNDALDDEIEPDGGYVQAGFFVDPKTLELAARYSILDCDDGAAGGVCSGNDKVQQAQASVNYYFAAHNVKAQLGYELINEEGADDDSDDINTSRWTLNVVTSL